MRYAIAGPGLCAVLLALPSYAEQAPADAQAARVQAAFEKAQDVQRQKQGRRGDLIKSVLAYVAVDEDSWAVGPARDGNPADRRGPTPKVVVDAQDAVSRPAPQ